MPDVQWIAAYLSLGLFVGFFSGLLGIGGGLIMVPVLAYLFEVQHVSQENTLHLALGTSMATILFTSVFSAYQHHMHRAVNWDAFRYITPGILLGTGIGAIVVSHVPTHWLTIFFVLFVYFAAVQMWAGFKPEATRDYPTRTGVTIAGMVIGSISSLVSIGGGVLSVPYLVWHKQPLRYAIATSAALGFPIALGGTAGYIANGMISGNGLPPNSLGYVYLPVLMWLVIGTMITAPVGAKTTHRVPVNTLKKVFAVFLFLLASKMLFRLFA